jgi:streptogramin lyase
MGSRRRQRHVFSTVRASRRGVPAVLALAALAALGCSSTASAAESPRGLHVISMGGGISPHAIVLADDGTPWFTASKFDPFSGPGPDLLVHVTADGRVDRYHLPKNEEANVFLIAWGTDGALWAVDEAIHGLIRVTPDGSYARFRDVWAHSSETLDDPPSIIAGPGGMIWLGDRAKHRIVSVAADGSTRVVATLEKRANPDLLAIGPDGSVWFSESFGYGLRRVLPDGRVEAVRFRNSEIRSASVAPNGDVWFIRSKSGKEALGRRTELAKRTDLVRIDREGRVTEFRAPRLAGPSITVATDGTVWIASVDGEDLNGDTVALGVVGRMDAAGHFERIYRAPPWTVNDIIAAPDGRLWLLYREAERLLPKPEFAAWLPPNPCLSRRRISLHLHSRRGNPIRSVRLSVQGRLPRTFHSRDPSIPIDLRGYLPGAVGVTLKIRTTHRSYVRHHVYHTCTSQTKTASN